MPQFCNRGHEQNDGTRYKGGSCKICCSMRKKGLLPAPSFCKYGHIQTDTTRYKNNWCKLCSKERERTPEQKKRQHVNSLHHRLNISSEKYNEMFVKQEGKCFICDRHQDQFDRRLAVDHNHVTGEVRALLCRSCNTALGMFKENPDIMKKAIQYIEERSYDR